jgi:hypothetical protein
MLRHRHEHQPCARLMVPPSLLAQADEVIEWADLGTSLGRAWWCRRVYADLFRSLFTFKIPDYWTPEQALAIVEFIGDLREAIWGLYGQQLIDAYREQQQSNIDRSSGIPPPAIAPSSGPS